MHPSDAVISSDNNSHPKKKINQGLYRSIWRWHFYAGIFCIPFILILSVSGAIYLFKPQIDAWNERHYRNLAISGERATANEQIGAALAAVPDSQFVNYRLPEQQNDAVMIRVRQGGNLFQVYVHPYSLNVLNSVAVNDQFIQIVKDFHGELLAGNTGSFLVELAACWAMVLIITGLYLWWPRSAKGLAGILYPRLRQGNRLFWRDLHAVTGIWIAAFTLFLLVTALPWSLVWGNALKEIRQVNAHGDHHHHHEHQPPQQEQDWSTGRADEKAALENSGSASINLTPKLLDAAHALHFAYPVELAVSKEHPRVWTVKSQSQNRPLRADAWIDAPSGAVLRSQDFSDKGLLDRAIGVGIAAHEGQLFGWFNQLLGLLTTLGLVLISVTGFILWRQRKPEGALGAPPALPNARAGKVVTAIVLVMAVLLPVLAISLVVIVALEWLVLRRIKMTREWLGIATS